MNLSKEQSRSRRLIAETFEAALRSLAAAPGGRLHRDDLMRQIESNVAMDAWAMETYESSGRVRWKSIFGFNSVALVKGGYVTKERGYWSITDEGRSVLASGFDRYGFLAEADRRYRSWAAGQTDAEKSSPPIDDVVLEAPEERMAAILSQAHALLAAELIDTVKRCEPRFFEELVVQLLLRMGYGGSRHEAGRAVGQSGDGGIDGIINEDRLGLDAIYLQAKRWEGSVGEGPIRDFKGALDAKGASKGVFITTSSFTQAALTAARNSRSYKIVLIDGARLADLMIEHGLGVSVAATFQLKRIDSDFFAED